MKLYKSIAIIVVLAMFCVFFSGCFSNSSIAESEMPSQSPEHPRGEGFAYRDAEIGCLVVVQGKDWAYQKDKDENQVLFYIKTYDVESENAIRIASVNASEDPEAKMETAWKSLKESTNVSSFESSNINVGDIYDGTEYDVTMQIIDNKDTHGKITIWTDNNKIFIMMMSYDDAGKESVTKAYNSIIESFCVYTGEE